MKDNIKKVHDIAIEFYRLLPHDFLYHEDYVQAVKFLLNRAEVNKQNYVKKQEITTNIYPPQCAANFSDRWLAEVRNNGWIADWKRFDTKDEAEQWASKQTGEISPKAVNEMVNMLHRWSNK